MHAKTQSATGHPVGIAPMAYSALGLALPGQGRLWRRQLARPTAEQGKLPARRAYEAFAERLGEELRRARGGGWDVARAGSRLNRRRP